MSIYIIFSFVGALIGYFTNSLAIKMLFKPYRKYYFFKFKIPFTPGLIPSKRYELAKKIAHSFEKNFFSIDEIKDLFQAENTSVILDSKIDDLLSKLGPFSMMARPFKGKILEEVNTAISDVIDTVSKEELFSIKDKVEEKINSMKLQDIEKLVLDVSSEQFQYITWFGALLGGLIGLIQALVLEFI